MLWWKRKEVVPIEIDYNELLELRKKEHCLVDSRGRSSFAKFHIDGAINIPDDEFSELMHFLPTSYDIPLIFYCKNPHCVLSPNSARKAISLGYKNVYLFSGGLEEWIRKNNIIIEEKPDDGKLRKADFIDLIKHGGDKYLLVDLNDPTKYHSAHIRGAVNFPYGFIIGNYHKLPRDRKIIFYCSSGARSEDIYHFLLDNGVFKKGEIFYLSAAVIFENGKARIIE
ncbi:MAG: rhodanese-like domain-containing protein [Calditerrivibrio sp.]|nr:rhodanese-like domain-containing protein [Calditerrivibrio sp.]